MSQTRSEIIEKIKEHDSDHAAMPLPVRVSPLQQVYDGIVLA